MNPGAQRVPVHAGREMTAFRQGRRRRLCPANQRETGEPMRTSLDRYYRLCFNCAAACLCLICLTVSIQVFFNLINKISSFITGESLAGSSPPMEILPVTFWSRRRSLPAPIPSASGHISGYSCCCSALARAAPAGSSSWSPAWPSSS